MEITGDHLGHGISESLVIRFAYGTTNVFDIYTYVAAIQVLFFFFKSYFLEMTVY